MNNPIRFIDPDGMLIDDYFSRTSGKYLGTDNAKTDNIRVIDERTFNSINTVNQFHYNASENTKTQALQNSSQIADGGYGGNLSEYCAKGILNYYYQESGFNLSELHDKTISLTRLPQDLAMTKYGKDYGLAHGEFSITTDKGYFGVLLNNKWDVINMFIHERGGHGKDFIRSEKNGISPSYPESYRERQLWEKRAVEIQMNHPSWSETSEEFRENINKNKYE